MNNSTSFRRAVLRLAVPAALQSMLQASFGAVDQIMIGQLGSVSVAGVGLAGKFSGLVSVAVAAVGAAAGIMISQYLGQRNAAAVRRSFFANLALALGVAGLFAALCALLPGPVMGLYTRDAATVRAAAGYLRIVAASYLPMAGATLLSTLFRCVERPALPLWAGIASALLNTALNYLLIFGRCGFAPLGARGAAVATAASQGANCLLMLLMLRAVARRWRGSSLRPERGTARFDCRSYAAMLLPLLACEVVWSLGENVYAAIYGHMGTTSSAAMTLLNPVQGVMIGALCGLSQAAGVLVGKRLGGGDPDGAYWAARRLLLYGAVGAAALSAVIALGSGAYVRLFQVEDAVRQLTRRILLAYALVAPFKVLNMILGGGILRSGGRTRYVMRIDLIGTWGFGVPLGLLAAFALRWPVPRVYFLLSLEECVRFGLSMRVFRGRKWMRLLEADPA